MSYNGSGTFLINSAGQPVVPGTTITTTAFNALTADLASGLTTAMTKDGQTVPTANIPMGGFKLTGLGAGTSATDAAQFGQLQNAPVATLITVSGADTITGTLVQTLTAYATGQQFSFVAAGTNTTAVTLNIDGLGAKAVTRTGAVALDAGALVSGQMAIVEYDGTRFQLINANAFTNLTVSGALTVGTTLAVTGVATLTAQPILSSLTASQAVFSDGSKGLVSNAITGSGNVVMSASPTLSGTVGGALTWSGAQTYSAAMTYGGVTLSNSVTGTGSMMLSASPTTTGTLTAAAINASSTVKINGPTNANARIFAVNGYMELEGAAGAVGIEFKNNTTGNYSYLSSEASDVFRLYSPGNVDLYAGAVKTLSVASTGASVTGTLGVTGTTTMAAINASGNGSFGPGGSASAQTTITANGSSANTYGPGIYLQRNSVSKGVLATESQLAANNSDNIWLYAYAGASLKLYGGGNLGQTIDASGNVTMPGTLGVTGLLTASGGLKTDVAPSTAWGIDQAQPNQLVTIANNGTYDLAAGGGLVIIHNDTGGTIGLFLLAAGSTTVVSDPNAVYSGTLDTASKTNIYWAGANYRIQNKTGGSVNYYIATIKTRVAG